ncbi:PAS domain S-box protein [Natronorubrum sp. DTA28]|uniref:PAS domain S-box protein n=1 Tax=Natronorubrum sp. DTA28 TaxID=3447019 RepID=UPI003F83AE9E
MSNPDERVGDRSGSSGDGTADSLPDPLAAYDEGSFFRQLVANTTEGVLTIAEDHTIVFANPAIEDILGYAPDELIGKSKLTVIPERLRQAHVAGLEAYIRTGDKHIDWDGVELPAVHKDGHEVPVSISLWEHPRSEDPRLFTGLFRDISERKLRERRFEAVFNNTYQFTGLLDREGTLLEVNETTLSATGLERDDLVGTPLWDSFWFRSSDRARRIAREGVECARDGEFFREEVRVQGGDRTAIIDFSVRPVMDHRDEIRWLLPEGRDITGHRTREQHLHVLHRLLRHNLRNDLNVISGYAEMLASDVDDEFRAYAAEIAATAAELIDTTETAKKLADSTLERHTRQYPVALQPVLSAVVDELRDAYPESTIVRPDEGDLLVTADERLATVFREVIENAIEHTDQRHPVVKLGVTADAETVDVFVTDDGPGIPETEQTGIFNEEPVTQTDHGSGLGLWLTELILDDYGGSLAYDSCSANGSRVTITLPRRNDLED